MTGLYSSDGVPILAGQNVSVRVVQTSGSSQTFPKVQFGIATLEPKGSGRLLLPATGGGALPTFTIGSWVSVGNSDGSPYHNSIIGNVGDETPIAVTMPGTVRSAAWSPDGKYLAMAGGTAGDDAGFLRVVDLDTLEIDTDWNVDISGLASSWWMNECAWSPDSQLLVVSGGNDALSEFGYLEVLDRATKAPQAGWPSPPFDSSAIQSAVFSNNGERLSICGTFYSGKFTDRHALIDVATKTQIASFALSNRPMGNKWSPDDSRIAFRKTGSGSRMSVWESDSGTQVWSLSGARTAMAWFPDGSKVMYGGASGLLEARDTDDGTIIDSDWPSIGSGQVGGLAFWPDGSHLGVAHDDGFDVIDVAERTLVSTGWPSPSTGSAVAFAYDPGNVTSG